MHSCLAQGTTQSFEGRHALLEVAAMWPELSLRLEADLQQTGPSGLQMALDMGLAREAGLMFMKKVSEHKVMSPQQVEQQKIKQEIAKKEKYMAFIWKRLVGLRQKRDTRESKVVKKPKGFAKEKVPKEKVVKSKALQVKADASNPDLVLQVWEMHAEMLEDLKALVIPEISKASTPTGPSASFGSQVLDA